MCRSFPSNFLDKKDKKKLKRDAILIKFNSSQKESEARNSTTKQSVQSLTQTEIPVEVYLEENINNNVAKLYVDAPIKQSITIQQN